MIFICKYYLNLTLLNQFKKNKILFYNNFIHIFLIKKIEKK